MGRDLVASSSGSSSRNLSQKLLAVSERLSEETLEDVHAFNDLNASNSSISSRNCSQKLLAVSERLSEETLEDVHPFNDLVASSSNSNSSRNIICPSSDNSYLETLEEEDSFDGDNEEQGQQQTSTSALSIPTIMEDGNNATTTQVVFDLLDNNDFTSKQEQ